MGMWTPEEDNTPPITPSRPQAVRRSISESIANEERVHRLSASDATHQFSEGREDAPKKKPQPSPQKKSS